MSVPWSQRIQSLKEIYCGHSGPEHQGHAAVIAVGDDREGNPVIFAHANSRTVSEITEGHTYPGAFMEVATRVAPQTWMIHYVPFQTEFKKEAGSDEQ